MTYLLLFLEGIITFISPCLLPMLPVYVSYFAGEKEEKTTKSTLINALGFVAGFTLIFILLGAFAGSIGKLLKEYSTIVNIVTSLIVVLFGLNYLGILKIKVLNKTFKKKHAIKETGFIKSLIFGLVFSIGWTPCVGPFLGSALLIASQQGSILQGMLMLLAYAFGLGIPFIISALLIQKLKSTFDFMKRNYKIITTLSGLLLVIVGILMMTGLMGCFLSLLTF